MHLSLEKRLSAQLSSVPKMVVHFGRRKNKHSGHLEHLHHLFVLLETLTVPIAPSPVPFPSLAILEPFWRLSPVLSVQCLQNSVLTMVKLIHIISSALRGMSWDLSVRSLAGAHLSCGFVATNRVTQCCSCLVQCMAHLHLNPFLVILGKWHCSLFCFYFCHTLEKFVSFPFFLFTASLVVFLYILSKYAF